MGKFDKKTVSARAGGKTPVRGRAAPDPELGGNPEYRKIAPWLSGVKFKKKAIGGLDPADVWKKLEELNELYEKALMAERVRCDLLIGQCGRRAAAPAVYTDGPPEDRDG